jgi:hypothetical protein
VFVAVVVFAVWLPAFLLAFLAYQPSRRVTRRADAVRPTKLARRLLLLLLLLLLLAALRPPLRARSSFSFVRPLFFSLTFVHPGGS